MLNLPDLKELEKRAFRATHQDGLWDIYIGGVVMSMAVLPIQEESDAFPFLRFGIFLFGLVMSYLVFWGGKKFLTIPRLGQVKYGPRRQRRKRLLALALSGIVALQLLLVFGTALLWANPQLGERLGLIEPDRERLLVAVIGALFVGPSVALIAYFNEYLRGYYIACVASLAVFAMIWFQQSGYLVLAGLVILLPGVVLLTRFLRAHPLHAEQSRHE